MIGILPTIRRLSRREKIAAMAGIAALAAFLFIQFALVPAMDERSRLNRVLTYKSGLLKEMHQLKAEFETIQQNTALLEKRYAHRNKGFTLFAFLDKLARDTGVKDNIAYMKPSSTIQKENSLKISMIEMKLQAVNLEKLTNYLYRIETSENMVTIQRASFTIKGKEQTGLDVVLQVQTVEI